ncbi:protein MIS12 homolog isoform X2 [Hyla sarda]|nr:protein MIS12 homolog isoform X2 [Hyla sarda]XP_056412364.1 protein MIS12 homolog isoform X2 [Hyla sarda]XP_056412365.1 protein MIS12 homolog isoform X2 [Hyla sarda]XP_056412366.1 protein MIS12 homolog isoform X2 [Hyla sarda]XP_056412367.1 protein MIS12 homolog isoform X2 [Hyla sarda]
MSIEPMCYETQFFGFTPQTCILRLYISFQDYLFDMLLVVESVILKKIEKFTDCGISRLEVRDGTQKYLTFVNERFNQLFEKMELCLLKMVLNVPRNVLLQEDKVHAECSYSKEKFDTLQSETKSLNAQCKAESLATRALLAELKEQKVIQAELAKILAWFDGMDKICREHGNTDLLESFAFMIQKSKMLQGTVKEIDVKHKKLKLDITSKKVI